MKGSAEAEQLAAALPSVLAQRSRAAFERLLAPEVRWGGRDDTEQTCHNRRQAGDTYAALLASGVRLEVLHSTVDDDKIFARIGVSKAEPGSGLDVEAQVLLTVRDSLVVDILQVDDSEPPSIELLYFTGCPNHDAFLPHLQQLLDSCHVDSPVQLVQVTDDQQAQRLHFLGSPSLRINGRDVEPGAGEGSGYGLQCRIYGTPDGPSGTPADRWILAALHA